LTPTDKYSFWPDWVCFAGLVSVALCAYFWLSATSDLAPWLSAALALIPPAVLIYIAWRRIRLWAEYIALLMIPYSCIGIMDIVALSRAHAGALLMSLAAIISFFAALDASRRYRN